MNNSVREKSESINDWVGGCLRQNNYIYYLIFGVTVLRLIWNFLYGFRWPSEFALLYNIFTYDYGFIPRGFLASVLKVFFGNHIYSPKFLYILITGTGLINQGCFVYLSYYFTIKKRNMIGSLLVLWYSLSIYSAYISHEMGYLEQYGYLIIWTVIILPIRFKKTYKYTIFYAVLILISLLISETNAFLICPVLLAMTAFRILQGKEKKVQDGNHQFRDTIQMRDFAGDSLFAVLINIPNLLYALWTGIVTVPEDRIKNIIALIRSISSNFEGRLDEMGSYFYVGRTRCGTYASEIRFAVWPWQLKCYLFLVVFFVAIVLLYAGYRKRTLLYILSSLFIMLCAYLVGFVAWDLERFKFGSAMMITFYGMWVIKETGIDYKKCILNKDVIYTAIIGTLLMAMIMDYRLGLFDGAVYNSSLQQLKDTLINTWGIHY